MTKILVVTMLIATATGFAKGHSHSSGSHHHGHRTASSKSHYVSHVTHKSNGCGDQSNRGTFLSNCDPKPATAPAAPVHP
jgi:hypothetical protein